MNAIRIVSIALIIGGILGLTYGGFSYTKETHGARVGSIELSIRSRQTVNVPVWAGVGAIVLGAAMLILGNRKG